MDFTKIFMLVTGICFLFFGFYINYTIHDSHLEHFLTLCNISIWLLVGLLFIMGSMSEFNSMK